MRARTLVPVLMLCLAPSVDAQAQRSAREVERFDVSGFPATPSTDLERQIALFIKVHRKGDLTDATRIHMLLSQYYKAKGDAARADNCNQLAAAAYSSVSASTPETAGSEGKPPFEPERTLRRTFEHTDDLNVTHTWELYLDGTFSHAMTGASSDARPTETGWYTRRDRQMRLWQLRPSVDRIVDFELLGPDGSEGAVMSGVRMKAGN